MRITMLLLLLGCANPLWAAAFGEELGIIILQSSAGPVKFTHQAHADLEGVGCADCHHTDSGTAVSQGCRDCHGRTAAGAKISGRDAFHLNCTGCHKILKDMAMKTGPTTKCSACHVK